MTRINIRKKRQVIEESFPVGITAIYSNGGKDIEEFHSNEDIQRFRDRHDVHNAITDQGVILLIYKYFNDTLRPGEKRRIVKARFYTYKAHYYRKINKDETIS